MKQSKFLYERRSQQKFLFYRSCELLLNPAFKLQFKYFYCNLYSNHHMQERENMSIWQVSYLLKLFLSLLFHPPDVLHGQTHPLVNPAEQLAVEVGENTLFLLWKEGNDLK